MSNGQIIKRSQMNKCRDETIIKRDPNKVYKVKKSCKCKLRRKKYAESTQKYRTQKERTCGSEDRIRAA